MPFSRKIILHVPVSDEALLEKFVEQCIKDCVSLVAIFGPDCEKVEDLIDDFIVGDGSDETRHFCTSAHPNESLTEVLEMVEVWEDERGDAVEQVRL
jgi:hypothetical protein